MKTYFFTFIIMLSLGVDAQTLKIRGNVTDNSGLPLPGVTVLIEGTTNGTRTDFDGNFEILAAKGDVLVFTYIGQKTTRLTVSGDKIINVQMEEDAQMLQEVVVTSIGIKREKRSLGYAVSNVRPESVSRTLSGKVYGVNITYPNDLSQTQRLALKNLENENEISETLYIVDGIPIPQANNSIIEKLNPHEIVKKHIYNPAKAMRTLGITGKKGCIVIVTKNGNYSVENDESYAKINENKFNQVVLSPLSTFSIDVDKASYSNIR